LGETIVLGRALRLVSLNGRASRREFASVLVAVIAVSLAQHAVSLCWPDVAGSWGALAVSWIVAVLLDWALLAVSVRRMHDLGKTGWLLALAIVPIAGLIILIWSFGRPGAPEPNRFGPAGEAKLRAPSTPP
jgi:uncharacterized membrane protein YhaH (DUF805 family)